MPDFLWMVVVVLSLSNGSILWVWDNDTYWLNQDACITHARQEILPKLAGILEGKPVVAKWGSATCVGLPVDTLKEILKTNPVLVPITTPHK